MKKLIAIAAMALTTGAFAADSYLYWMLNESSDMNWGSDTAPSTYTSAKIGVMDASTGQNVNYLSLYTSGGVAITSGSGYSVSADANGTSGLLANLSSYANAGYSYYIELFNDGTSVGRSEVFNYAAAATYITSSLGGTSALPTTAWAPTSFTTAAIPEPTSGLLMLVGLAGLALRRKRQQMA